MNRTEPNHNEKEQVQNEGSFRSRLNNYLDTREVFLCLDIFVMCRNSMGASQKLLSCSYEKSSSKIHLQMCVSFY
jgi:hypothetical protein